ncbi:hypothetical protein J53TS2_43090 [Paenibacillus sp. J53TS2]|nr:hypothetical protein J53TS2_43090 [Paenibacillus sp. J53TS2]
MNESMEVIVDKKDKYRLIHRGKTRKHASNASVWQSREYIKNANIGENKREKEKRNDLPPV